MRHKRLLLVTQKVGLLGKLVNKSPPQPRQIKNLIDDIRLAWAEYESCHGDYLVKEQGQEKKEEASQEHDEAFFAMDDKVTMAKQKTKNP